MKKNFDKSAIDTFDKLLKHYKNGYLTDRQFIAYVKKSKEYQNEVIKKTEFLNDYKIYDIIERLYYIVNGLTTIVKCKYCDNKATWRKRGLKDGYREICNSKECRKKQLSETHFGTNIISNNRDNNFIKWQNNVTEVNDDIIKKYIKYDKFIDLITNPILLNYLNNRYKDSENIKETLKRIKLGIEEKPICAYPGCTNPVTFIGRKRAMFSKYCCLEHSCKSKERIRLTKESNLRNWGTPNVYDSEKYQEKMLKEYGVRFHWQRSDIKEKRNAIILKKYGLVNLLNDPDIRKKSYETLIKNGKNQKSDKEDEVAEYIESLGYKIKRHYFSDIFQYNVDIYIPDYDLYIEYQGSQFHNTRSYMGTKEDVEQLKEYEQRSNEIKQSKQIKKTQYDNMIYVWSILDVHKRLYAQKNGIRYFEIYKQNKVESIKSQLEFLLFCIDKKNVFNISEDVLKEEFNYFKNASVNNLVRGIGTRNFIIKQFQCTEFYKNEMEIFATQPNTRRKLIQNRCKYLNKKEWQLTPNDILTGFKKSGIYYGYSHFNPLWTNYFINHYNIHNVYDPCGGWGHHMLGMLSCDKIIYNDINTRVCENISKMKKFFNINNLVIYNNDATTFIPENVDAFFMCPPYFNVEHYEKDFNSLNDYALFLNEIFKIWNMNSASIFGLIIREDFVSLINETPTEVLPLEYGKSHFSKLNDKNFKEYFYIFKKQKSA